MLKRYVYVLLFLTLIGPLYVLLSGQAKLGVDWRHANRTAAHIAPQPEQFKPALVQVYAARTYGWRGLLAAHTWIAVKPENATTYTVYQIIGWNIFYGRDVLSITQDAPDRYWFGNKPWVVKELRGDEAARVIPLIQQAVTEYPYQRNYNFWPGPNSNTFPAFIGRKVPELNLQLPSIAIGKDYLDWSHNKFIARTQSNTGYQFSIFGLAGLNISKTEGLEISILGLVYGINPMQLSITLPGIGKMGFKSRNG